VTDFNYTVEYTMPTPDPAENEHRVTTIRAMNVLEALDKARDTLPAGATVTNAHVAGIVTDNEA
jgi:hypothetical protein